MKSIFDSSFKYTPSFETDVQKTFDRIRREQQTQIRREDQAHTRPPTGVTKIIGGGPARPAS
jgi:hypothetical protein